MLPLTKLVRTVGGGFRREKVVQTVIWLRLVTCRKCLQSDLSMRVSMSNAVSVSPRRMAFLDIRALIPFLSSTVS